MKEQVTTIDQSRRLLELGIPAEKASMVWEYWINQDFSKVPSEEVYYNLNTKANRDVDSCDEDIPAFTVDDLLGILQSRIGSHLCLKWEAEMCWFKYRPGDYFRIMPSAREFIDTLVIAIENNIETKKYERN